MHGINSHEGSFTAERKYVRTHANVPISRDVPPRLNQQSSRSYVSSWTFFFFLLLLLLLLLRSPLELDARKESRRVSFWIPFAPRNDGTTGSESKRNAAKLSDRARNENFERQREVQSTREEHRSALPLLSQSFRFLDRSSNGRRETSDSYAIFESSDCDLRGDRILFFWCKRKVRKMVTDL